MGEPYLPRRHGPLEVTWDEAQAGSRWVFVDAPETYLRAIFELEEETGNAPKHARLRSRLGLSRSAVYQQVQRLGKQGLMDVSPDYRIHFTEEGRRRAARVMRKHRLAERLLVDVIGLDWECAHTEAARWQHVLGDGVERRLLGMLQRPWMSPYGNPIPALDELAPEEFGPGYHVPPAGVRADLLARVGGGRAVVQQICESAQSDVELLRRLRAAKVLPGATVDVTVGDPRSGTIRVGGVALDTEVAGSLLVVANPVAAPGSGRPLSPNERPRPAYRGYPVPASASGSRAAFSRV